MQVLKEGVIFKLLDYGSEETGQVVAFTEKGPNGRFISGTTNEEVINMMVERMIVLNKRQPANDNLIIIHYLKSVRQLLAQRVSRKIENKEKREQDNNASR